MPLVNFDSLLVCFHEFCFRCIARRSASGGYAGPELRNFRRGQLQTPPTHLLAKFQIWRGLAKPAALAG